MKTRGYIFGILVLVLIAALVLGGCRKTKASDDDTSGSDSTTTTAATTTTTAPAVQQYPFIGYINATTLNVRPTPDTDGYPIGGLKWGDTVTVTSRNGDWYAISFAGQTGYINAQYVQDTMPVVTTTTTAATTTTGGTTTTDAAAAVAP